MCASNVYMRVFACVLIARLRGCICMGVPISMCVCIRVYVTRTREQSGTIRRMFILLNPIHLVVLYVTISNNDGTNNSFHTTSYH